MSIRVVASYTSKLLYASFWHLECKIILQNASPILASGKYFEKGERRQLGNAGSNNLQLVASIDHVGLTWAEAQVKDIDKQVFLLMPFNFFINSNIVFFFLLILLPSFLSFSISSYTIQFLLLTSLSSFFP